jgi:CubicO group peptidase (beta-lactamase class C family)
MQLRFLIIFTCLTSCSSVREGSSSFEKLDQYFQSQMPANEPGGAVLIMKRNQIAFSKGYGIADTKSKTPIDENTLFNLGSISKTFVANAILILESEGKLSVDDPLEKYFNFKNKEIAKRVTLRNLLTHTSGLPDNRNVSNDSVFYLTAKDEENWAPIMKVDTLHFEPGSRFEYSNPAFNGLALIVEKVSGTKWQKFIEDRIMRPAGMTKSTITDGPHPEAGVAHGYNKNGVEWTEDDYGEEPTFAASGNGGVWSSVAELARYELAIRNNTFLSKEKIADSRTPKQFSNWVQPNEEYIGWSWFTTEKDGVKMIGHTGSQGGFLCNYQTIPDKDILIVILCNTPRDVSGFTEKILTTLKEMNYLE